VEQKKKRNQSPAQLANLRHFRSNPDEDWRTPEQRKEWAKNASAKAIEVRRKKKRMSDAMKWLLSSKDLISDEDIRDKLVEIGAVNENGRADATNAEVLAMVALRKAAKGDVEALKFVRDTGGESPSNRVELTGDPERPIATMDLRTMSEEELLRIAEAKGEE